MDFDTLIYIFFIVISIIASIFQGKKKSRKGQKTKQNFDYDFFTGDEPRPDQPASDQTSQQASQAAYDPVEEGPKYVNYDEEVEDVEEEEKPVKEDVGAYNPFESPAQRKYREEQERIKQKEKEAEKLKKLAKKFKDKEGEIGEEKKKPDFEFEPVKAIIYSEIIKRPEFWFPLNDEF